MKALLAIAALGAAALTAVGGPAVAADHRYRLLSITSADQVGFMDVATLEKTPGGARYTALWVEPEPHDVGGGMMVSYALRNFELDCAARTSRMTHVTAFDDRGVTLADVAMPDRKPDQIGPGAAGEEFMNTVCGGPVVLQNPPEFSDIPSAVAAARTVVRKLHETQKP